MSKHGVPVVAAVLESSSCVSRHDSVTFSGVSLNY
jgi:hypothetical protein